jgi:putative ABC transport system substrate-binding protein
MDRRAFLAALTVGLLAAPLAAGAQPLPKIARIGILGGSSPTSPEASRLWAAFFEGLRELGYVEGQNIVIEGRFYGDDVGRLPSLAAELVRLQPDVIAVGASPAPEALKRATSVIPIVLINHGDPVGSGLAANLAKPGGNVTGVSMLSAALRGKQLQLLNEILPRLTSVAVLSNPTVPAHVTELREIRTAARDLKLQIHVVEARIPEDLPDAVSRAVKLRSGALFVLGNSSIFFAHRTTLVELAAKNRLPALYTAREYVEAGGLLAYTARSLRENFRHAARYVDRILKGAKPGDLPIEQPTKFELVINLRTAKALGLTMPPSLLQRADQVIE